MTGLIPASEIPAWVLKTCSIVYFRVDWADVVDDRGRSRFQELDRKVFSTYRKHGLKLSFRLMAANMHSNKEYVTPKAILDKGIPTVIHTSVRGKKQVDPVFWDEKFLEEYNGLTRELGRFLDGQSWAGQVDLGGMGEWGEMHLSRWTGRELAANGFTHEKYLRAVIAMMDEMDRSLPRVVKAFCVAPILMPDPGPVFAQLVDRAARRGWWLRSDGCSTAGPPPYVKPYAEKLWTRMGIICEPSGGISRSYHGGKASVAEYFKANLKWHPSVLNLMGMWDLKKLSAGEKKICEDAARKAGYRLTVDEVVLPKVIARPESGKGSCWLPGRITFSQRGVAPYYGSAVVVLKLIVSGKVLARRTIMPEPPFSQLLPGKTHQQNFLLEIPAGFPGREIAVLAAVEDIAAGPLELGNAGQDAEGWLPLGSIKVSAGRKGEGRVFELGRDKLWTDEGVQAVGTAEGVRLTGVSESGWNYGGRSPRIKARSDRIYIMKIRMRARKAKKNPGRVYFKFDVEEKREKWKGNINTPKYDFSAPWTWQELSAIYRPKGRDAEFMVAIEKGTTAPSGIDAEIGEWTVTAIPVP